LRRIPLSRRSHIIGFQPLPTGTAEHESALERDFVTLTSFLDPHAVITAQPITITYQVDGAARRYTPDYSVAWSDGRREIVEIKYLSDLRANRERFRERFAAMEDWARVRGATFRIATEREIRGWSLENAKRLLPLRSAAFDPDIAQSLLSAVRRQVAPTFAEAMTAVPADRPSVLATLWCLLARGTLHVDLSLPITPSTIIGLP
jgi:TnsA-like endonuclease N terminal